MPRSPQSFSPTQASAALGVSPKALRVYEEHGLLAPGRTRHGWRIYEAADMERAAAIIVLRKLGLSLVQVRRALDGAPEEIDAALAMHEARLSDDLQAVATAMQRVRSLRADLAKGNVSATTMVQNTLIDHAALAVGFSLPWPWAGEWFALHDIPRLSFITGPLGSGKTRFAQRLAAELPDAAFLALDRLSDTTLADHLASDVALAVRIARSIDWLLEEGAERSDALTALVVALETSAPRALVVDMVEEGLSEATQVALMAYLRLRKSDKRALLLMTRSSAILDLDALDPADAIIFCPPNHSPPFLVAPLPSARGYEAVATCVAPPAVRARTAGTVAIRQSG